MLFPDTYNVSNAESEGQVIDRMIALMERVGDQEDIVNRSAALGRTLRCRSRGCWQRFSCRPGLALRLRRGNRLERVVVGECAAQHDAPERVVQH